MVGGCAALVGVVILGPRKYMGPLRNENGTVKLDLEGEPVYVPRFEEDGTINQLPPDSSSSQVFCALGTLIRA